MTSAPQATAFLSIRERAEDLEALWCKLWLLQAVVPSPGLEKCLLETEKESRSCTLKLVDLQAELERKKELSYRQCFFGKEDLHQKTVPTKPGASCRTDNGPGRCRPCCGSTCTDASGRVRGPQVFCGLVVIVSLASLLSWAFVGWSASPAWPRCFLWGL